jgi:hypothetical protein
LLIKKISKVWLEKQNNKQVVDVYIESNNESKSDGEPPKKEML